MQGFCPKSPKMFPKNIKINASVVKKKVGASYGHVQDANVMRTA